MYRSKGPLPSTLAVLILLFVTSHSQSNSRSYDTNDWIPVSRSCPTCIPNSENQQETAQKKPTGRVLNLPASDEKRFFPEEPDSVNSQLYQIAGKQYATADGSRQAQPARQSQFAQQPTKLPDITTYIPGGQHVLLPPQLQSLISQGQPVLSPQRINTQLLQDTPFQQSIPPDEFRGNISQYNPRDFDDFYDQRLVKQNPQLQQQHRSVQPNFQQSAKQNPNNRPEEVQLLYVPLENLRPRGQNVQGQQQVSFPAEQPYQSVQSFNHPRAPPSKSQHFQSSPPHKQAQLHNIEQDFVQQALQAQKLQEQLQQNIREIPSQNNQRPVLEDTTSFPEPVVHKKRKPHQPPLAVYMGTDGHQDVKITDVLSLLKDAKSISVQDSVGPDSPQVFVGPSQLEAPDGYVKFDLPYLSSIEGNRVERKVDQLPFFVAPLSYKAPQGYSKIPFPAPHVGSVVVNHMKELEEQARQEVPSTTERNIPLEITEQPTSKPRIRQRPPARVSYPSSSIPPPPRTGDIPYQSLSKQTLPVQPQNIDDSLISSNPYGPTQFIQTTTPVYHPDDNPIPEQLFSTYGRLTTPTSYKNQETVAGNQQQYIPSPKQHIATEQPVRAPTQSGMTTSDKFTVLEQFPVPNKQNTEKYQKTEIPERAKQNGYRQNEELINNYQKTLSQDIYNNNRPTDLAEQYQAAITQTPLNGAQQYIHNQNNAEQPIYLQQYNRQTIPQINNRNQYSTTRLQNVPQLVPQQQHILQDQTNVKNPVDNINPNTRQRGRPSFTPEPNYYVDEHTSARPNDAPTQYTLPHKQTFKEHNNNYNIPQTPVRTQPTRTRGRQHFTPQPEYIADYEEPTESIVRNQQPVTKVQTPTYNAPVSTQQAVRNRDEIPQTPEPYYHGEVTLSPEEEQGFVLPLQLAAINQQLPGLVNSLEDQAIRPLLAPLLIPPSEETPAVNSTSDYYTHSVTSTTTTTTTTTTPAPIIETTTQSKRVRARNRGTRPTFSEYTNTTPTSRRPSQYRGRRPYSGRTRTEHNKPTQYLEEVTPTTNVLHQDVATEAPARSNVYASRNRFAIQRERVYASSTTEIPRRTVSTGRQRFRTRGRPTKTEDEYSSIPIRTTTDNVNTFKQPTLQGGFQASVPVVQTNAYLPNVYSKHPDGSNEQILIQSPQQGEVLAFVPNTKPSYSEDTAVQINQEDYNSGKPTPKSVIQNQEPLIPVSAPENNIVGDAIHVDPASVPNQTPSQIKYNIDPNSHVIPYTSSDEADYNSGESQYPNTESEPEHQVVTTTEAPRVRGRTRTRQRPRTYSGGNTVRKAVQKPITTTVRTTTEGKDENSGEEFYGFFRQPDFVKPVQAEYKETSYLHTPQRTVSNVAYLSREQDDQPVYVNTAETSQEDYQPFDHSHEANVVSIVPSTTTVPATTSFIEETTVDIKPVTRRPTSNFIRSRRPSTITHSPRETSGGVPEKYYTVRPSKRPDSQTPKITRIRGRIRKPTKQTTTPAPVETEAPNTSTQKPIQVPTQVNSANTNQEHITPIRQRSRLQNRGRSHFQYTPNNKHLPTEEPESPNYPPSFLQAHGLPTPKPAALISVTQAPTEKPGLTSEEIVTPKLAFQLTIEPDDTDDEYEDQLPYSSVSQPKLRSKDLEDGAESQFSSKIVEKPTNYNFISSEAKNVSETEQPPNINKHETNTEVQLQVTTGKPDDTTFRADATTDIPITTTTTDELEVETSRPKRKGYWRLVNQRPVGDDFESAESQNFGTVYGNNLRDDEKPERKYKTIKRVKATTSIFKDLTTMPPEITTAVVHSEFDESIVSKFQNSRREVEMLAPLYEMFGLDYEFNKGTKTEEQQSIVETTTQSSTTIDEVSDRIETTTNSDYNSTDITEVPRSSEDETLVYSDQNPQSQTNWEPTDEAWKSRIIGTSTTTEISHETEICYRGRCVKSTTSENSSEV